MTPPQITTLIDVPDNVELVRDTLASILLLESSGQQGLARAAGEDPELWRLRVFVERSNPWDEYLNKGQDFDKAPIVNVRWDKAVDDEKTSNVVVRQTVRGTFFLDCYGYGVAAETSDGHVSGDEVAAKEAQRAARLVRNILMAAAYTYLGLRGTVWRRWRAEAQAFEPPMEQRAAQHVQGVRVTMRVDFNELSPQVEGPILALITVTVQDADNGEVTLFEASYPQEPPSP